MTPTAFAVRRATPGNRPLLQRMLELYQYELSDIWDQDLDLHGEYGYALDRYWHHEACQPFIASVDGHPAGFALVDGATKVSPEGRWMDQFFVMKKYRRCGLGRRLATQVFDELPGRWEVGQMTENLAAQAFWRRVVADRVGSGFTEHRLSSGWWQGIVQAFEVPPVATVGSLPSRT